MFDTKIAIAVRDDFLTWQKLNVTAFLPSGVLGADKALLGDAYEDADGQAYSPLIIQPMMTKIHQRGIGREVPMAIYIEDIFSTGHDAENRAAVKQYATENLNLVGLGLRGDKKIVDKTSKGAKMHP